MTQSKVSPPRTFTQYDYEHMFVFMLTGETLDDDMYSDCRRIMAVIKHHRNIQLSVPASSKFWKIKSSELESKWLDITEGEAGDQYILYSWDKLIGDWYSDKE